MQLFYRYFIKNKKSLQNQNSHGPKTIQNRDSLDKKFKNNEENPLDHATYQDRNEQGRKKSNFVVDDGAGIDLSFGPVIEGSGPRLASGGIAQLVEQWTFNPLVPGSSPGAPTIILQDFRLSVSRAVFCSLFHRIFY